MQATPKLHLVYSTIADVPKFEIMSTECVFFILTLTVFLITTIRFKKIIRADPDSEVVKLLIITGFGTLFLGAVTFGTYHGEVSAYEYDKTLYKSNKLSFIEGRVANFYPMPPEGHADEEFTVKDSLFNYSKYETGRGGYHKTAVEGGVIKNNLYVRIGYYYDGDRNIILKLETE